VPPYVLLERKNALFQIKSPIPMYITRRQNFILGLTLFEVLIHGKVSTTQNVKKEYRINWGE
jgi:hypothetical protein